MERSRNKYGRPKYTEAERIEVFWAKVDTSGDCWEWQGAKDPDGYGQFWNGKRLVYAHRFAFELEIGPIGNLQVCHHCDNPGCVNLDHLFLGTQVDNIRDCVAKERFAIGENHGNCKLTDAEVAEIRAKAGSCSQRKLGAEYGVSGSYIGKIIRGVKRAFPTVAA